MIHVILFAPEIPGNTGNIIRLCANTGSDLHLIEPLGFSLDEKAVKRSGLDYHDLARLKVHSNWGAFRESVSGRCIGVSTKGAQHHADFQFEPDDILLFGPETRGLPDILRTSPNVDALIRIPMTANTRSLNLSNAVAIVLYEAWRQMHFQGGH